jgi:hypothetical protein
VLLLFFVITAPTQAAEATNNVLGAVSDGATAIVTFFKNLL